MVSNLTPTDPEDIFDGGELGAGVRSQPNVAVKIVVKSTALLDLLQDLVIDLLQSGHLLKGQGSPS
jgi:hypothetical protein